MTTEQELARRSPASLWSQQAHLLARVAHVLALEVELDRLFPQVVGLATEVLHADRSSLFLYDRERDELWGRVAQGMGDREIRFPAHRGLAGAVLEAGHSLSVADPYADPRFDPTWDERTGYRTRSVLAAPVRSRSGEPLGVIQVLNKRNGGTFGPTDLVLLEAFASHVAVALERALLTEAYADRQRMKAALGLARDVQRSLLPEVPLDTDAIDIAAYLAPADAVGGDFYDYFQIDRHRVGFSVGDVAGKGMPAALHMVSVQTLLRAYGRQGLPPAQCLDLVNETSRGQPGTFASLVYGVIDMRTGRVEYGNAGHTPPIILRPNSDPVAIRGTSQLPLCAAAPPYEAHTVTLQPGDGFVLYTDGVVEATASDREPLGEERLLAVLRDLGSGRADDAVHRVLAALEAFASLAHRQDDVTLLVLYHRGP